MSAEIITFVCDYPTWSDEEGSHPAKNPFVLTFILDDETGKAYMKGNLGTEDVQVISADSSITFVEITDTGNVMTTTIDSAGKSVHSRNSVLFGEIVPTQYYGTCIRQRIEMGNPWPIVPCPERTGIL